GPRHPGLSIHGRRSNDVGEAVDRRDSLDQGWAFREDFRIRMPRGQLQRTKYPQWRTRRREEAVRREDKPQVKFNPDWPEHGFVREYGRRHVEVVPERSGGRAVVLSRSGGIE